MIWQIVRELALFTGDSSFLEIDNFRQPLREQIRPGFPA
jgi:hypothetical protein